MEVVLLIILIVGFVALYAHLGSPSAKGAAGERHVSSTLERRLDGDTYRTLDDLILPTSRGTTQIDHVVLSPYGVFVVETKNMSGWIFGSADQNQWTQVFRKQKFRFQNPIRQNYAHVRAVKDILGISDAFIHNVVVFVGHAEPRTPMPRNVLWNASDLPAFIRSRRNQVFSDSEMRNFATKLLSRKIENTKEARQEHILSLQKRATQAATDKVKCPRCTAAMVERKNKQSDDRFWGCSRYPKCRGTRPFS